MTSYLNWYNLYVVLTSKQFITTRRNNSLRKETPFDNLIALILVCFAKQMSMTNVIGDKQVPIEPRGALYKSCCVNDHHNGFMYPNPFTLRAAIHMQLAQLTKDYYNLPFIDMLHETA